MVQFDKNIKSIEDLKIGMKLEGIVNNITNFGCFVDIGIKESGLVHISKLANEFISDVNSVVHLNQRSEEHTSELQSRGHLVCRLLLEKKKERYKSNDTQ